MIQEISKTLSTSDGRRLRKLESEIELGIALIGRALFEIRENRLYRITHGTFEDYCRDRFDMSRRYINLQIQAASVMENLGTNCSHPLPRNEAQARPLASLPKGDQSRAWKMAQSKAKDEGVPITARHVEKAVAEIRLAKSPPDQSSGNDDPCGEDENRSEKYLLLKSIWMKTSKLDRVAFVAWVNENWEP